MSYLPSDNGFAKFEPLPATPSEEMQKQLMRKDMLEKLNHTIKGLKLKEIKSDYLGTMTYYYQESMNKIYGFDNSLTYNHAAIQEVSEKEDKHLREINNLPPAS